MLLLTALRSWFSPTKIIVLVIAGIMVLISVLFFFSVKEWLETNRATIDLLKAESLKKDLVIQTQSLANQALGESIERWKAANLKLQQDLLKQQAATQRAAKEKQVLIETLASYNVSSEIIKDPANAARIANSLSADSFKLLECLTHSSADACASRDGSTSVNPGTAKPPANPTRSY